MLKTLTFSIDGPENVNDRIRGRGTFQKTTRAIRLLRNALLKRGIDPTNRLIINSVISADNFDCIDHIVDIAKDVGVRRLCVSHLTFNTQKEIEETLRTLGEDLAELSFTSFKDRPDKENPKDVLQTYSWDGENIDTDFLAGKLRKIIRESELLKINATFRPRIPLESIGAAYTSNYEPLGRCLYPFRAVRIGSGGSVYFCPYIQKEMGNLKAAGLSEIWNNATFRRYRKFLLQHGIFPICKRCCKLELVRA